MGRPRSARLPWLPLSYAGEERELAAIKSTWWHNSIAAETMQITGKTLKQIIQTKISVVEATEKLLLSSKPGLSWTSDTKLVTKHSKERCKAPQKSCSKQMTQAGKTSRKCPDVWKHWNVFQILASENVLVSSNQSAEHLRREKGVTGTIKWASQHP